MAVVVQRKAPLRGKQGFVDLVDDTGELGGSPLTGPIQ